MQTTNNSKKLWKSNGITMVITAVFCFFVQAVVLGRTNVVDKTNFTILDDWNFPVSQEFYYSYNKKIFLQREPRAVVLIPYQEKEDFYQKIDEILQHYKLIRYNLNNSIMIILGDYFQHKESVIKELANLPNLGYLLPAYGYESDQLQIFSGQIVIDFAEGTSEIARAEILKPFIVQSQEKLVSYVECKNRSQPLFEILQAMAKPAQKNWILRAAPKFREVRNPFSPNNREKYEKLWILSQDPLGENRIKALQRLYDLGENQFGLDLKDVRLVNLSWNKIRLPGIDLSNAKLNKLGLSMSVFSRASFNKTEIADTSLTECDFLSADMEEIYWLKVDCRGANFSKADFTKANLKDSSFQGANLSDANLSQACFDNIGFYNANFSGAHLENTKFLSCDLRSVKNLNAEQLCKCAEIQSVRLDKSWILSQLDILTTILQQQDIKMKRNASVLLTIIVADLGADKFSLLLDTLGKLLSNENNENKKVILECLGKIGNSSLSSDIKEISNAYFYGNKTNRCEEILQILKNPKEDSELRKASLYAWSKIEPDLEKRNMILLQAMQDNELLLPSLSELSKIKINASNTVPVLLQLLMEKEDITIRRSTLSTLYEMEMDKNDTKIVNNVVSILIKLLYKNPDDEQKRLTILILAKLGPYAAEATPTLLEILKEENLSPVLIESLLYALRRLETKSDLALKAILKFCKVPELSIRIQAISALGKLGLEDKESLNVLLEALNDSSVEIRNEALNPFRKGTKISSKTVLLLRDFQNMPQLRQTATIALELVKSSQNKKQF